MTKGQQLIYDHVTEEPRKAKEIADAAGMNPKSTRDHLMALKARGLVIKELHPTRWRRA